MRSIDNHFYSRKQWIECKNEYLKSVNHLCERCLKAGRIISADIVHHKVYMNENTVNDPALAYGFDNLEALCLDCHNKEHFGTAEEKRYQFVNGKLVIDTRGE